MLKNITQLEAIIADKVYHFACDIDSPLPHVKEAILKFLYYVNQIEEQVVAQQKAAQDKAEADKAIALVEEPPKGS